MTAPAPLEAKPMEPADLGRYLCVAAGGCLHAERGGRTVSADGVWVRQAAPTGPDRTPGAVGAAHRDCYERWAARWTG